MDKELQFLIYNTPEENVSVNAVIKDETICRDTEELEKKLPGKDKYHQCNKRHNSSTTYDRLTFFIRHTMSHGKKDRHRSQRVGQREE
jgi:hypothetical protein